MLGRTCLRRLQTQRSYICLPCLHGLQAPPPVLRPRAHDAYRAALYHSSPARWNDDVESKAAKESDQAPPAADVIQNTKQKKKRRKQDARAPAAHKAASGQLEVQTTPAENLSEPVESEGSDGIEQSEKGNGSRSQRKKGQDAPKLTKRDRNILKRRERQAAKKASKKAAKKAGTHGKSATLEDAAQSRDIGDVLQKTSEKSAAEVLAEAAKASPRIKRVKSSTKKAETLEQALQRLKKQRTSKRPKREFVDSVSARDTQLTPIDVEQPPIPQLSYGLDRVLFNPGVYHLQDPRSQVYNFDPYLEKIMPVADFNFDLLKRYITSSQDETLSDLASSLNKRYVGSTSSMTSALAHFHFLLSNWRQLNLKMLSKGFPEHLATFTRINRLPAAIFLRWKNGTYAIDADKQYDTANVLSMLGRSMEKLLTLPTDEYERYRRGHPNQISEEEREEPESYHYTTQGDMLMRSQLDAQDNRLPGTGMFDLKTRAVVSIRMDVQEWEQNTGYQIKSGTGKYESFEREYYDMIRSTMLKYSLQVRMGRMDGIFVAYHNIERIFGFQYVSLEEMDAAIHNPESGTRLLGDQEFRLSVDLLNKVLNIATEKFPETSLRFHFETREGKDPFMYIFAEPMSEEVVQQIQDTNKASILAWEKKVLGLDAEEAPEAVNTDHDSREDATMRGANHPAVHNPATVDTIAMPDLFEIPEDEPDWSSLSLHNQTEVLKKEVPEESHGQRDGSSMQPITDSVAASDESQAQEEQYHGPLLCLKLFTRNKINGTEVNRVTDVTEDTEWTVDYQIDEVSPADAYRRYAECKKRRSAQFADPVLREEDQGEAEKVLNYYQQKLREISKQGREWRDQRDEEQKDKEKIVYQPYEGWVPANRTKPDAPDDAGRHGIGSVDGYMRWLYGKEEN